MNPSPPNLSPPVSTLPAADAPPASSFQLSRIAWIALVVVILAAVLGLIPRWRERGALRIETAQLAIPNVVVTRPAPGRNPGALSLPAEVRPFIEAPIYARASGFLMKWLVDIGAQVEAGQLLAEIDTPDLNQELAHARAELAQSDAALGLARVTAARWVDLLKTSSVSEQEAAEKQSDLALKLANVEAAKASVRRLEELQSFAHVTAPFAGTITARKTDVGELIAAGSVKELFRLAQTQTLRVYVHVPQTASRSIGPGQAAALTVPELPGRVVPAHVVRTSGAIEAQSRTLLVELEVDNSKGDILAGSYAQVRFPDAKPDVAMTVPSNTIIFRSEGVQVGVVKEDGVVVLRNVTLGRDFGPMLEVLDGISPTDRIIVNPSDSLLGGTRVRVTEPAKATAPASK